MSTHTGLHRPHNEDAIGYLYPDDYDTLCERGALFVLADGVGSLPDGEKASHYAVDRLIELYYQMPLDMPSKEALERCIEQVNAEVFRNFAKHMATTIVAVVVQQATVITASVGDSRMYWFTGDDITQYTQDHTMSYVNEKNQKRNKLTRAIGHREEVRVDIHTDLITRGQGLLIVSDGATAYLNEDDLLTVMRESPREIVRDIIHYSNLGGGHDNISAIMISVDDLLPDAATLKHHLKALEISGVNIIIDNQDANTTQPSSGHWLRRWMSFFNSNT